MRTLGQLIAEDFAYHHGTREDLLMVFNALTKLGIDLNRGTDALQWWEEIR